MPQLFPVFDTTPVLAEIVATPSPEFKPDFLFDYDAGDFVLDGANRVQTTDGNTAWRQWCIKQIHIVRYALLGYDNDTGIDYNLVRAQKSRKAQEAVLAKTITEALMVDPRTKDASGFSFTWEGDQIWVEFTATPVEGASISLRVPVPA